MQEWLNPYLLTLWAVGATAGLLLLQMLVLDYAGIKAKHLPGAPVPADHGNFLFRATRAHANTNESIAAFILLVLFGILTAASARWLGVFAWVYVGGRIGHMLCYYADLRLPRSISFGVALVGLLGMLTVGVFT